MTPAAKTRLVKTLAGQVGFDLVGVTLTGPLSRGDYYRRWLAAGHAAQMAFLARNVQLRVNPAGLLAGARSVICVAVNYKRADGYLRPSAPQAKLPPDTARSVTGLVAQYARGHDYHVVIRRMLNILLDQLRERLPESFQAAVFVDTGPLLERELAVAAGLGWFGKNTCLLSAQLGSYLLLGEAVTTLELAPDAPGPQGCGSCNRCIQACPTGALMEPYRLNTGRCLAYLTIEHRGRIPTHFHRALGRRVFGCDACQQVCPYNARAPTASHPEIAADLVPAELDLVSLLNLAAADYRRLTRGTALVRVRCGMWRRNAAIALGNCAPASDSVLTALSGASRDLDVTVAEAAAASLDRIGRA